MDLQIYRDQCAKLNKLLLYHKKDYFSNKGVECGSDQRALYKLVKKLMGKGLSPILPSDSSDAVVASKFSMFFSDKVEKAHSKLMQSRIHHDGLNSSGCTQILSEFHAISSDYMYVLKLIKSSKSKTCSLDPVPTLLLKSCSAELLPIVTEIITHSLSTSTFSSVLKQALVYPLIKKVGLDKENYCNYRPVSNLSFISKHTETS